ncbi:MAG TPA: protocatechuate 3,4-dioxygenase [Thermohalobaculum sp.]|nr:protocatechuate 3,4-dioxygenase [Thermohalobaculum sp.]
MTASLSRRLALGVLALGGAAAGLARTAAALVATPPQTAGPFYPPPADRPGDDDWDLVKVAGKVREAGGEVMHLAGRVLDAGGEPVAGALIEIWQCDANGRYLHHRDRGGAARDPHFQGFGATRTDAGGRYRFRTIRPVPYPGRTPHIHARVIRPDGSELITQIYLDGHPLNQRDFLFRRLGRAAQAAASIGPAPRADGDLEAAFDFVV